MEGERKVARRDSREIGRRSSGARSVLAGVEVRDEDLEPQTGLNVVGHVFRVSAVVILLLALWQFVDWWMNRPPGDVGLTVLVSDTIRLIVVSALLWAASNLADLIVKSHWDIRAGRILIARQTYMMQQMGIAAGTLPPPQSESDRRGLPPEDTIPPGTRPSSSR